MGRLSRSGVALGTAGLLVVGGGAYALGASGGAAISVCVKQKGGALYQARKCAKHDKKLTWNSQGPRGAQGIQGTQGTQGIQGIPGTPAPSAAFSGSHDPGVGVTSSSLTSVGSLNVPAGNYAVVAKTWANNQSASTPQIECKLIAGSDTDDTLATLASIATGGSSQALSLNLVHSFSSAGTIDLQCASAGSSVSFVGIKITAIQVGSVTSGALGP